MSKLAWLAAAMSVVGLYLLSGCADENCLQSTTGIGDAIAFAGAVCWYCCCHIWLIFPRPSLILSCYLGQYLS